jgi:hypothetical protein
MNNALRIENISNLAGIMLQAPPLRQLVKEYTHAIQSILAIFLDAKRIVKIPVVSELERDSIVKRDIHDSFIFLPNVQAHPRGEEEPENQTKRFPASDAAPCSPS